MVVYKARRWRLLAAGLTALGLVSSVQCARPGQIMFRIEDTVLHKIDSRIFGHFMERPSWGEIGPEGALVPGTRQLQPEVLALLREMKIPILRFPGGTDVDYIDWRDMVDKVPGRGKDRPITTGHQGHKVTNNFGYDEFLALCEDLGAEAIVVVNLRDAFLKQKPLEEAAMHAAGLVAYCNAAPGSELPSGMIDWAAVRTKNGRGEPYRVKYWQIGNETWAFTREAKKYGIIEPAKHYVSCLVAYIDAMRAVDPNIKIIVDPAYDRLFKERLIGKVDYIATHHYVPWGIGKVTAGGKDVPIDKLTPADIWYAWVSVPRMDELGRSVMPGMHRLRRLACKVAVTEWNWNGWWGRESQPALNSSFAKGVGAGGYLHALMRAGDTVKIGCQSMLVGNSWGITSIRADKEGEIPGYFMPTGQVTMFYSRYHGDKMLAVAESNVPTYAQPYTMGSIRRQDKVAYVDAVATANDKNIYFHAINRHFEEGLSVSLDLSDFAPLAGNAVHHVFEGRLNDQPEPPQDRQIGRFRDEQVSFEGSVLALTLPKRSVSCIEIPR